MWKVKTCLIYAALFLFLFLFSGCFKIEPTFTKEKAASSIAKICEKEFGVSVKVWLLGETVLVYVPQPRLFDKGMQWDKEILEKVNKAMIASNRVILSMKPRPEFLSVCASDTEEYGLDYTIVTYVPDMIKLHAQVISREEFLKRNLIKLKNNKRAFLDVEGNHLEKKEIKKENFIEEQIKQRVELYFGMDSDFKDYAELENIKVKLNKDIFDVLFQVKYTKEAVEGGKDIPQEIAGIIAHVIEAYGLDFIKAARIKDISKEEELIFSKVGLENLLR